MSDIKDFTPAELLKELNEMKTGLEVKAKEDAKEAVAEQLKAVNDTLELLKKAKEEDKTAEKLKQIKEDLDVTIKAFDKLQVMLKSAPVQLKKEKSFNDAIAEAVEQNTDNFEKMARGEKGARVEMSLDVKAVADVSTANVTGGTVWGAIYKPGIVMNPNQIGHVRTFMPVVSAGAGTDFYFMRENGAGEGSPTTVSEKKVAAATNAATGLKPQFDVDLIESSVKFETIAGFMVTSNKALRNIPSFTSFLQSRLPEKLYDVEDAQVLYGDGTSPNIKGILTAGNFVAGSAAGATPLVEKILIDLGVFEDTYKRTASVIVMRPLQYWSFFRNKSAGSGEYDLPGVVAWVGTQLYIAGVPVVKSTALTTNDYFIGASNGAELQIQEGLRIEFFREDGTNVRTNQVTIRVEETIALPVYGSDYFMKGSAALA